MGPRASTVAALLASIAWVTTVDAQTRSTNEVQRPIAVFEAYRASFEIPTLASPTIATANDQSMTSAGTNGVGLGAAFGQALGFTIFQHMFRLTEEKTRQELGGPFFADWFTSVSHLGGNWDDGGKVIANYVAHPMGGAVYANIYRQNDRRRRELEVGEPGYGGMVWRALMFSAVTSAQFELGPFSEASIGNVGISDASKMAWGDLVMTPTLGVAWMVAEDVIDEQVLKRMDSQPVVLRNTMRFFLNPSRSAANLSRSKWPWYRARDVDPGRRRPGAP